jgi:hypothetical protein
MKRILIGTCAALACAVSLAAQTPATSPPQDPPRAAPPSTTAEKTITLKGCLRAGDQPDAFVLANASSAMETTGTTGTPAGAAAPAMKNKTVRLIGAPAGFSLKEHVGHTVEVTGMIAPQGASPSAGATPPAGATPGAAATTGSSADARLNVKNVKHVDAKCGE